MELKTTTHPQAATVVNDGIDNEDIKIKNCELRTETSRVHTGSGLVVKHAVDAI